MKPIDHLIELSRRYGAKAVQEGGGGGEGTSSCKDGTFLSVKAEGLSLADIDVQGVVQMRLDKLREIGVNRYAEEVEVRETQVFSDLMAARCEGQTARPSVEALLHGLIDFAYVFQFSSALVNGLTCSREGKTRMEALWGNRALWIALVDVGYVLAVTVKEQMESHRARTGTYPALIFLQNQGVIIGADRPGEIDDLYAEVMSALRSALIREPDLTALPVDEQRSRLVGAAFGEGHEEWVSCCNVELQRYLANEEAFAPVSSSFTPAHVVYSGLKPAWVAESVFDTPSPIPVIRRCIENFDEKNGAPPQVLAVQNTGVFAGTSVALAFFINALMIGVYAESFGGYRFMSEDQIDHIHNSSTSVS